jgi:hypothetical protein
VSNLLAAIPQPPVHDAMPKTAELLFTGFLLVLTCIALVAAIRRIARGDGTLLLYCVLGGAIGALFEPIVDVLGLCYLKEDGAIGTYTYLDRTIPLYLLFAYPWYNGGLAFAFSKLMERGVSMRALFAIWAVTGVADVLEETPGILAGTYTYYGKQPFDIWGFPLWWAFVNPLMPLLAGALIYRLRPHMKSAWSKVGVIALIPMAGAIANAAAATPTWMTLNLTHSSYVWTYLGGLATLGLALYAVWMIGCLVARPAEELSPEPLLRQLKRAMFRSEQPMPRATPQQA